MTVTFVTLVSIATTTTMAIAGVWTSIYCAVFSIPAGSTDTRSLVALALNSITARVTVTCVAQDSAPSLIAHTALVVAVSVYTAQTTHFDSTVRAGEAFLTLTLAIDALPPVVTGRVLALIGGDVTLRPFPALVTDTHTLAVFSLTITKVGAFTF